MKMLKIRIPEISRPTKKLGTLLVPRSSPQVLKYQGVPRPQNFPPAPVYSLFFMLRFYCNIENR